MARDRGKQLRDENPHQGASHSLGRPSEKDSKETSKRADKGTDRERSIETRQEGQRSASPIRRQTGPSVHGPSDSPFSLMRRMAEDMDRLFDNFAFGRRGPGLMPTFGSALDPDLWSGGALGGAGWSPQVETFRRGDKLVVRADLPGMKKEDVRVDVENNVLTISGERREEREEDEGGYYRSERSYGQFYRAIPLPDGVELGQCDASFKDGVLEVTLPAPKESEQTRKRIQIR